MTPALRITRPATESKPTTKPARPEANPDTKPEAPPLVLDIHDVARGLKTSAKTVRRMHAEGKLPAPLVIGSRSLRWCRETLVRWVAAGGPSREEFEQLEQQAQN